MCARVPCPRLPWACLPQRKHGHDERGHGTPRDHRFESNRFRSLTMLIWLTAGVTVLLFVYLGAALMRPEWF